MDVPGFYDGDGSYRVRFSPEKLGAWKYETASSAAELHGKTGEFTATPPGKGNHGPVRVHNAYHFAYADGTPFKQVGTTIRAARDLELARLAARDGLLAELAPIRMQLLRIGRNLNQAMKAANTAMLETGDKQIELELRRIADMRMEVSEQVTAVGEAMRGEDRMLRRQADGPEVDMDALVEAIADRRGGAEPSQRLFCRRQRDERRLRRCVGLRDA